MNQRSIRLPVALVLATALACGARAQSSLKDLEDDVRAVVARVVPYVVRVDAYKVVPAGYRLSPREASSGLSVSPVGRRTEMVHYSGIAVLEGEYILTVPEAVSDAERIVVRTHDGRELAASPVGEDSPTGVAVLRVPGLGPDAGNLADSRQVTIGSLVVTVGNPYGLMSSPSLGMVSGLRMTRAGARGEAFPLIQISAPVNPGDFGGAAANTDGQVLGMIVSTFRKGRGTTTTLATARLQGGEMEGFFRFLDERAPRGELGSQGTRELFFEWLAGRCEERRRSGGSPEEWVAIRNPGRGAEPPPEGVNFVLPIHVATGIARRLLRRPRLGLRVRQTTLVSGTDGPGPAGIRVQGLRVVGVVHGGAAEEAGVRSRDIVRSFNGQAVTSIEMLERALARTRLGDPVRVTLVRGGEVLELTLCLRAADDGGSTEAPPGCGGLDQERRK